ncbi:MAG: aminotransferase class III-fold pyridoxal phosphate-dependent enzyme, partial [Gammaproteobacteria bacterium]
SMFLARHEVMDVFRPGDHGSTFGGNPLAATIALEALNILLEEDLVKQSAEKGAWLLERLRAIDSPLIREVRGRGLFIGLEIEPAQASAREVCERLMKRGLLSKETHETVVRLAPPLAVDRASLEWAADQIAEVLREMESDRPTQKAELA